MFIISKKNFKDFFSKESESRFSLKNKKFDQQVTIWSLDLPNTSLNISNCEGEKIMLSRCNIWSLELESNSSIISINECEISGILKVFDAIESSTTMNLSISNSRLDYISVNSTVWGELSINECIIKTDLSIESSKFDELEVIRSECQVLEFDRLQINSIYFEGVKTDSLVWTDLDLSKSYLTVNQFSYNKVMVGNVKWPLKTHITKSLKFPFRKNEDNVIDRQTLIELQKMCNQSGNDEQAEKFYEYSRILSAVMSSGWVNRIENIFTTWMPFFLSGFGRNFLRPLVLLFVVHLLWTFRLIFIQGTEFEMDFNSLLSWDGWNLYF